MAWATSSAVTSRPIGCRASSAARSAAGSSAASSSRATHGVSAVPGATPLTRIPSATWSAAIASVSAYSAPLLALYTRTARQARPRCDRTGHDDRRRRRRSQRRERRPHRAGDADTLTSSTRCHSSSRVVGDRSLSADPGVGDDDVEPTVAVDDVVRPRHAPTRRLRRRSDVPSDRSAASPVTPVGRWSAMSSSSTAGAAGSEQLRSGESDSGRAAGDARDEALEVGVAGWPVIAAHSGPSGNRNRSTLSGCMRAPNPGTVGAT